MNIAILPYFICILVNTGLMIGFGCSKERHSLSLYLMFVVLTISDIGYISLALSTTLEEAILANKILYLDGVFLPMLIFLLVCNMCQVRIPMKAVMMMYLVQMALFGIICTSGYTDIFYKSMELCHSEYGFSYLEKVYGPAHIFSLITMCGYLLACLVISVVSLFRKTIVSYKNVLFFIVGMTIGLVVYLVEGLWGIHYEIVPIANTVIIFGLSIPTYRMSNYYIQENVRKVQEANNSNSYIAFNIKLGYMGCNMKARELFPEITKYRLEEEIPYSDNLIYRKILPMLREYVEDNTKNTKRFDVGYVKYDCRINPIKREEKKTIGYLVELEDATEEIRNLEIIRDYNRNLESEVLGKTQRIREIQDRIVLGMAQMVESRDLSTGGHIKRTSNVINIFARELLKSDLGLSEQFLVSVEKSAPMHDLGKIAVDDRVLRKPGKYTPEEYEEMKKHPTEGARVVREILTGVEDEEFMKIAINVAHYHHEKMDGTGYPDGLKGEEIPMEARIMALADVFDALVSKRCYKEAFSYDKAFAIIEESAGSHFDPQLAKVFLKCRPRLETLYENFK